MDFLKKKCKENNTPKSKRQAEIEIGTSSLSGCWKARALLICHGMQVGQLASSDSYFSKFVAISASSGYCLKKKKKNYCMFVFHR